MLRDRFACERLRFVELLLLVEEPREIVQRISRCGINSQRFTECLLCSRTIAELFHGISKIRPRDGGIWVSSQNLSVSPCRLGDLALVFKCDRIAQRDAHLIIFRARMNEDRCVSTAAPRLVQTIERDPTRLPVAPLCADQTAVGVDAVGDDVVKKIVIVAGRVDDLQHQDDRPAVAQFVGDQLRRAGDELRVESFLPRGDEHIDSHHPAARFRQRSVPLLQRCCVAVMLQHGRQRACAARLDSPPQHRNLRHDSRRRRRRCRSRRHRYARCEKKRTKGEAPSRRTRPFGGGLQHVSSEYDRENEDRESADADPDPLLLSETGSLQLIHVLRELTQILIRQLRDALIRLLLREAVRREHCGNLLVGHDAADQRQISGARVETLIGHCL